MTKSPTIRLLLGLLITLGAVTGFSWYSLRELNHLRKLQTETIDLNRHDSLLLLRVQSDLNAIGLKLRDTLQLPAATGISEYQKDFERLHKDLERAVDSEAKFSPVMRHRKLEAELVAGLKQFWQTFDELFAKASAGDERGARALALQLAAEQATVASRVSSILEGNTQAEAAADQKIANIYDRSEEDIYAFLAGTILAILVTSLYLIYSNRQIFEELESLSRQRRVLAARLISVQEEVLRSVSRELHDEFGQILTAVGAMLARAERKGVPPDSPLRTELSEIREITQNTLDKMRSLSQILHPAVLDDYGLAKGIEWYTEVFQRQTGIETNIVVHGHPERITGAPAIHCFRIVQEALTNAAKHSATRRAEVEMTFSPDILKIQIRDFGLGLPPAKKNSQPGLGLIAMRERAELINGKLNVSFVPNTGTTVSLEMPLPPEESPLEGSQVEGELTEVMSRNHE